MRLPQGDTLQAQPQATCFVCGSDNPGGLQLRYEHGVDGTVNATWTPTNMCEGFRGIVHGGIVASILDAAMVRCLHGAFGKNPFTCRLDVRYLHEMPTGQRITIGAHVTSHRGAMCWAEAEISLGQVRCAHARGIFKLV